VFADAPEIGIVRKIRPSSGLVRYEAHNDALEWSQALKDTLAAEKPKVIVVMLGLNDRQPLREVSQAPQKSAIGQSQPALAQPSSEPHQQASDSTRPTAAAPMAAAPAASDASRQVQTISYDFHTDKWSEAYGKRIDAMIAALKTIGVPRLVDRPARDPWPARHWRPHLSQRALSEAGGKGRDHLCQYLGRFRR
jgi:uncharacterized protein